MDRGQEAEHVRHDEETALWRHRTQETFKTIRGEVLRVEAARIARGYGVRLAEEDDTLAAKVKTFILDQAADRVDQREAERFPASSARRTRKSWRVWNCSTERGMVATRQFVYLFLCRWTCRTSRARLCVTC